MSLTVDVSLENVRTPVSRLALAEIARATLRSEGVHDALISVTLVDRRAIARLNQRHLGHRGATDVISFGFTRHAPADPVIGDLYISPEVARDNARERDSSVREEVLRLVVHGVLHVLGYDHPEDDAREQSEMWRRQERLVSRFRRGART